MELGTLLYNRFLAGDASALEELVRLYSDGLVRFACMFVGNTAEAEDVMADTFAALIVKKKKFREEAAFKTYLYKIARNKAADVLRARKKTAPLSEQKDFRPSAEELLLRSEREKTLFSAMEKLPPQYREILQLTYLDGFSVKECRKILKKNDKQIYNLLARAKLTLKKILCKDGVFYEDL